MSMIICKECHKEKSNLAKVCPNCGFKKPNFIIEVIKFFWGLFFLFIFGMILLTLFHS